MLAQGFVLSLAVTSVLGSALSQARALVPPTPRQITDGEFEDAQFWSTHAGLFKDAWLEYGKKHPSLYHFDKEWEDLYLQPQLLDAVRQAKRAGDERGLKELFTDAAPGVSSTDQLFSQLFLDHMSGELAWLEHSGIPIRRPNGMNRFGGILSAVEGSLEFNAMLEGLTERYLRPIGLTLFPGSAVHEDVDHHYGFVVQYEIGADTKLNEHADASTLTMNLCLLKQDVNTTESTDLRFAPYVPWGESNPSSTEYSDVSLHPGQVLWHRGQHQHAAVPLTQGKRVNLIVWFHGMWGRVRVAPYEKELQLQPPQRWRQHPWDL